MKRATSYKLVKVIFILAVALSALLLIPATLNYLELYVALSHMYLKVNSFDIYPVSTDSLRSAVISANFSIVQNSSYVGLSVLSVDIIVYYGGSSGYSNVLFSRKFTEGEASLGPYSRLNLVTANETYVDQFSTFADYNNESMMRGSPVKLLFWSDINVFFMGSPVAETVNLDNVVYQMPYYVS